MGLWNLKCQLRTRTKVAVYWRKSMAGWSLRGLPQIRKRDTPSPKPKSDNHNKQQGRIRPVAAVPTWTREEEKFCLGCQQPVSVARATEKAARIHIALQEMTHAAHNGSLCAVCKQCTHSAGRGVFFRAQANTHTQSFLVINSHLYPHVVSVWSQREFKMTGKTAEHSMNDADFSCSLQPIKWLVTMNLKKKNQKSNRRIVSYNS